MTVGSKRARLDEAVPSLLLSLPHELLSKVTAYVGFQGTVRSLALTARGMRHLPAVCARVSAFRTPLAREAEPPRDMLRDVVKEGGLVALEICSVHPENLRSWTEAGFFTNLATLRTDSADATVAAALLGALRSRTQLPALRHFHLTGLLNLAPVLRKLLAVAVLENCPMLETLSKELLQSLGLDRLLWASQRGIAEASYMLSFQCLESMPPGTERARRSKEWMCVAASQGHPVAAVTMSQMCAASQDWLEGALWLSMSLAERDLPQGVAPSDNLILDASEKRWRRDTILYYMREALNSGSASAVAVSLALRGDSTAGALKLAAMECSLAAGCLLQGRAARNMPKVMAILKECAESDPALLSKVDSFKTGPPEIEVDLKTV